MSITNVNTAISAYSQASGLGSLSVQNKPSESNTDFFDLVGDGIKSSIETIRHSESVTHKGLTKEADITDVISAVTNAEATLRTVVAIRDRMVSAMQEVLRMPI